MSQFLPIQILLGLFLLFAVTRVLLRLKDGALTLGNFIFWLILWIFAGLGLFRPELTSILARKLGIGRGSDAVVYGSILVLFYLIFRTNVLLENLRHDLTKLIRLQALKDAEKKK